VGLAQPRIARLDHDGVAVSIASRCFSSARARGHVLPNVVRRRTRRVVKDHSGRHVVGYLGRFSVAAPTGMAWRQAQSRAGTGLPAGAPPERR
jgi:hypothetical protein